MKSLQEYCTQFSSLTRAPGNIWGEATHHRAPHKPFLLLAIMDLVRREAITTRFIDIQGDLDELDELFTDYWNRILPGGHKSSIAFPFFRLKNEPFWELVIKPGKDALPDISTVKKLREYVLGARLDDALFAFMQYPQSREALAQCLFQSCFSASARQALAEVYVFHEQAFQYSTLLEEKAHGKKISDIFLFDKYRDAARNQGFRRIVVKSYEHRCALCGVRIITPEGRSAVDAAHIVPWRESRNDDIGNGMALCKLCHWAFDEGLMGVSKSFTVLLSEQLGQYPNAAGLLGTLSGRGIVGPSDKMLWPKQENLRWHRSKWSF
ncbi:putative restriction endonuclease [Methylomagnum ishizawai]|uniref:Putative restriction endonuclease n=1 Tax=Methylomagnum ishizawai TaxID=1760988 RepID=A0A1Y6CSI9_9GAMM|nr:HNH endonuclease [Methylomagnum ishizawai]SMF93286.1 putative restriction endonuclease [Methylomagnum ishizawai]